MRPRKSLCHAPDCKGVRACKACARLRKQLQRSNVGQPAHRIEPVPHSPVPHSRGKCAICGFYAAGRLEPDSRFLCYECVHRLGP